MPVRLPLLVLIFTLLGACSQLPPRPTDIAQVNALPAGDSTHLDQHLLPIEQQHPKQSGFRLVSDGYEAFAFRLNSIQLAERSIDIQTYIWHPDLTGGYLAHALLQAADRGVRIRVLIDDMDARSKNYAFAGFAAHPNISVRLFNPFASRSGMLGKLGEVSRRFNQMNRRMHNKTWIVDNRVAITGGRNLGDEYFGASEEANFVDLDIAMLGPVVRDASTSFDRYWNAPVTYPIQLLTSDDVTPERLATLRAELNRRAISATTSHYAQVLQSDVVAKRLIVGKWRLNWTDDYRFLSDDPMKVRAPDGQRNSVVLNGLLDAGKQARSSLWILSPYFVPGKIGMRSLREMRQRGVEVRVVTNSLAANDVVAVHSGYKDYRKPLLETGIELWELKPLFKQQMRASLFGSSGASLHSKALIADAEQVFVGSYNLDPRSANLNTEQGVLVRNTHVASEMQRLFLTQANDIRAWQLSLDDDKLHWRDKDGVYRSEPESTLSRRVVSWLMGLLPIERHL